jgi:hypothetical protein
MAGYVVVCGDSRSYQSGCGLGDESILGSAGDDERCNAAPQRYSE